MAVKYTCDACGKEMSTSFEIYHIEIINGNNTAIMNESNTPDLCEDCARDTVAAFLPVTAPAVEPAIEPAVEPDPVV